MRRAMQTRIDKAIIETLEQRQLLSGYLSGVTAQVDPLHDSAVLSVQWGPGFAPAQGDTVVFYHARPVYQTVTHRQISITNPFGPGYQITSSATPDVVLLTIPGMGNLPVTVADLMRFADPMSSPTLPIGYSNGLPIYNITDQTDPTAPDFADAASQRETIGSALAADAEVPFSNVPIGTNWVWAEYLSGSGEVLDVSPYIDVSGTLQPSIHILQGPTHSVAAPPDFAVTLVDPSDRPLVGSGYAQPEDSTTTLTASAQVQLQTPSPLTSIDWLPEDQWGIQTITSGAFSSSTMSFSSSMWFDSSTILAGTVFPANSYPWLGGMGNAYGSIDYGWLAQMAWGDYRIGRIADPIIVALPDTVVRTDYAIPTLSGQVSFFIDGMAADTVDVTASGQAHYRPSGLSTGHHTLRVAYTGNAYFTDSEQTVEFEITRTPVSVTLTSGYGAIRQGGNTLLSVTASVRGLASSDKPKGTVGIYCDDALLAEATLGGPAGDISVKLPVGVHHLKAVYLGDGSTTESGVSDATTLVVQPSPRPFAMLTLNGRTLSGWAVNPDQPNSAVQCTITLDGQAIRTITANRKTSRSVGMGRHGLQYVLPRLTPGNHRLSIVTRDAATSQTIALGGFGIAVRQVGRHKFGAIAKATAMPLGSQYNDPWTGQGSPSAGSKTTSGYDYYLTSNGASLIS